MLCLLNDPQKTSTFSSASSSHNITTRHIEQLSPACVQSAILNSPSVLSRISLHQAQHPKKIVHSLTIRYSNLLTCSVSVQYYSFSLTLIPAPQSMLETTLPAPHQSRPSTSTVHTSFSKSFANTPKNGYVYANINLTDAEIYINNASNFLPHSKHFQSSLGRLFFVQWLDSPSGPRHPHCRGFAITRRHTHTHTRQDSSGRVISPSQRPLPASTQHSQQTHP